MIVRRETAMIDAWFSPSLQTMPLQYRIGHGFDVHRFRRGRRLVLGGVVVPYPLGLDGHSDADVVIHALINALLGAAGAGDIGSHFPDSDARYKGIASAKLLQRVLQIVDREGFTLVNGDVTVIAQKPRLLPFVPEMRKNLARLLGAPPSRLNIKAVTTEGLGWVGEERGMAATAVVLLQKKARRRRR